MNIFVLDYNHKKCAEYHCDKHVVKMPLETTQMLSTVFYRYNEEGPYKIVHQKHPCTLWAGQTLENYRWLWRLGIALCKEYTYRYERIHACERVLYLIKSPPTGLIARGFTKFAQAMPEEYKNSDPILAYQDYYYYDKQLARDICTWKKRKIPPFMEDLTSYHSRLNQNPSQDYK